MPVFWSGGNRSWRLAWLTALVLLSLAALADSPPGGGDAMASRSRLEAPPASAAPAWRDIAWGGGVLGVLLSLGLGSRLWVKRRVAARTAELQRIQQRLSAILDSVDAAIYVKSPDLRYLYANRKMGELLGVAPEALLGRCDSDFFETRTVAEQHLSDRRVIEQGERVVVEERRLLRDGERAYTFLAVKRPVRDARGETQSLCAVATDITEYREIHARNHRLTFYDALTGLPNRRLLLDRLEVVVKTVRRSRRHAALLFINLDNFKVVNELEGLPEGDQLLRRVASNLARTVRESDTLARPGADEFVVLLHDLDGELSAAARSAERVAEKLQAAVLAARPRNCAALPITASIGITLLESREASVDLAMQQADIALHQAKAGGGNTLRFFSHEMQVAVMARVRLEADLHQALPRGELELHYQTQVDATHRVTGAEALLRWRHPQRGLVSPGEFIPLAESSRLIVPIGHWVLEQACRQLAAWAGTPATAGLSLAVNVSSVQFQQADFVAQVEAVLADTGAPPQRLVMELTESLLMDNPQQVRETMQALSALGIRFALDDFGTGFSSLGYLKRLPLHQLKIDQSFIRDVLDDAVDAAIVRTVISLADSLALQVTAEGVERAAQHAWLHRHGCRSFQGYLFSRPVPRSALVLGQLPAPAV